MRRLILGFWAVAILIGAGGARQALAADVEMRIVVTNGGQEVPDKARYEVHPAGKHDGPVVRWAGAGSPVTVPEGDYDVDVIFQDGAAEKSLWLDNQHIAAGFTKTVEIALPVASVIYHLANDGAPDDGKARVELHKAGKHDSPTVVWSGSDREMRVPEGIYDVQAIYQDGAAGKDVWLDGQTFAGKVEKSFDFGVKVASVTYHLTVNGAPDDGKARVELHAAGKHDGPVIAWAGSDHEMRVPDGAYDVQAIFGDGAVNRVQWFDGQSFSGKVEKTVEVGAAVASVTYHLTVNGAPDDGKARVELHAAGKHDGPVVAWAGSDHEMRVPDGAYDVRAIFDDGAAHREFWIDNQPFSGKVEKTLEVGARVAAVTYHLMNDGEDLTGEARVEIHPAGKHDGPTVIWSTPGKVMRLPDGAYDVAAIFAKGFVEKLVWLDGQAFTGAMDKTFDFHVKLAQPTVSATLSGADVGDKAQITFYPAGKDVSLGAKRGGETAWVEEGAYDLLATAPGAEGWLRNAAISGKPQLVVPMKALKVAELKPGGPPPKTCMIEVYGVNFDFNKSDLRPDADPVLKSVQKLFSDMPTFRAEVGGHTDNVGKPDYNLKLSDARAAAVKGWLVRHGIAADRVTSRGYGDTRPLVDNDTDAHRFKNRRVELRRENCQ